MTLDEAKRVAANPTDGHGITDVWQALTVLSDALRAAESQVAYLNAKLDATHVNRCFNCEQTVTEATMQRQSGGAEAMREQAAKVVDALARNEKIISYDAVKAGVWAPINAAAKAIRALPVPAAPTPGPTTFDAEAAMETALMVIRDRYPRAGIAVESIHLITMLDEALAAGRRGTR